MVGGEAYIAVDWGSTNRRAWLIGGDGAILDRLHDDAGALSTPRSDFPARVEDLRSRFGRRPVVAAGMVGSANGWVEVPYLPIPAGLDDMAARFVVAAPDVWLVPGLALTADGRHDVMRGEETQVLGAIAAGLAPATGRFCLPGTHNKWIAVEDGRIVDCTTALTGELFALLRAGSSLADMLAGVVDANDHFRRGLARGAGARDLLAALFEIRAAILLGAWPREAGAAIGSGILIGSDVGSRDDVAGADIHLIGATGLAPLYAAAIEHAGGRPVVIDAPTAFLAGVHALWRRRS